jgi:Uma2 family endonuclease
MISTTTPAEASMSSAAFEKRYTPEEYLALEREAPFKSEYVDGVIVAMAGASRAHNVISANLIRRLGNQLDNRPCEAYTSDMRVLVSRTGLYTCPDVVVICGEALFLDDKGDTLLNPTVIFEVLSPTTETYDRGRKFGHYRQLDSLREYVLIAQDRVAVERYVRRGDEWVLTDLLSMEDTLSLPSIDCHIPLREIYARVTLPEAPPEESGLLGPPRT